MTNHSNTYPYNRHSQNIYFDLLLNSPYSKHSLEAEFLVEKESMVLWEFDSTYFVYCSDGEFFGWKGKYIFFLEFVICQCVLSFLELLLVL